MKIQVFTSNIKSVRPIAEIDFDRFINAIGQMKPELKKVYEDIKQAEIDGDLKKKGELKTKLYYFVPCVYVDPKGRRSYKDIQTFNGILHLDFDHIDNAEEFKYYLFEKYDFVIAAWVSASGKGVKALVNIPIAESVKEFKAYFWGLAKIMQQYKGFDTAPQNAVLPLFLSPDDNILFTKDYSIWTKKGVNPKDIVRQAVVFKHDYSKDEKYKSWAISNTEKGIKKIFDNGHPQLRAAAFSLGGYVGGGYISEIEAISLMDSLINSNYYLSQKPETYMKTSRTMIKKGQFFPINF